MMCIVQRLILFLNFSTIQGREIPESPTVAECLVPKLMWWLVAKLSGVAVKANLLANPTDLVRLHDGL
jgi:hypothetical protein